MALTFKGGIFPPVYKDKTKARPIEHVDDTPIVILPLSTYPGTICTPLVNVGDRVYLGQLIADSDNPDCIPVHSTVSGKVIDISAKWHPNGNKVRSIVIENDFKDTFYPDYLLHRKNPDTMSSEEIIDFARESGIVGMGGQGFPTHLKLKYALAKQVDTLIINGAECEPFIAADERAMIEYPKFILGGVKMLMKALGLDTAYIGIEKDKANAISTMSIITEPYGIKVVPLHTKYPQGSERQLVYAVTHREIKPEEQAVDAGCVVFNVDTAASLYRSASTGMPLIRRVVTISGDCVKTSKNALVRIGTPLSYLVQSVGGFTTHPKKIILGGPMMGTAQHTLDAPLIKQCSGLLALGKNYLPDDTVTECIRCGRCVDGCPVRLMPIYINMFFRQEKLDELRKNNVDDCIECGSCSFVCPAKIPLVQIMRMAKFRINTLEDEEDYS